MYVLSSGRFFTSNYNGGNFILIKGLLSHPFPQKIIIPLDYLDVNGSLLPIRIVSTITFIVKDGDITLLFFKSGETIRKVFKYRTD